MPAWSPAPSTPYNSGCASRRSSPGPDSLVARLFAVSLSVDVADGALRRGPDRRELHVRLPVVAMVPVHQWKVALAAVGVRLSLFHKLAVDAPLAVSARLLSRPGRFHERCSPSITSNCSSPGTSRRPGKNGRSGTSRSTLGT